MLTETDHDYLARRRKSLRHLRLATWGLPLFWLLCIVVGAIRFPALLDPMAVGAQLDSGIVDWSLIRSLARVAPMLFLSLLLVVTGAMIMFLRHAHRERRLLDLVDRAERGSVSPP